jgi:hypothetical protein
MIASYRMTRTSVTSHQLAAAADLDREDAEPWTVCRDSLAVGARRIRETAADALRGLHGDDTSSGMGWHARWHRADGAALGLAVLDRDGNGDLFTLRDDDDNCVPITNDPNAADPRTDPAHQCWTPC